MPFDRLLAVKIYCGLNDVHKAQQFVGTLETIASVANELEQLKGSCYGKRSN